MNQLCVRGDAQVRHRAPDLERLKFQIKPVPPYRLDVTVQALCRRAINAVDRWDGTTYRRILVVNQRPLAIEVAQIAPSERPMLQVTASGPSLPPFPDGIRGADQRVRLSTGHAQPGYPAAQPTGGDLRARLGRA